MNTAKKLLIATRNTHKTREFAAMLGNAFAVADLSATRTIPTVEETGATFEENATIKALQISRLASDFVLADDSGLEVDLLHGEPGVRSARYAGPEATDKQNRAKLMAKLVDACGRDYVRATCPARFRCVLALAVHGDLLHVAHGVVEGHVICEERGHGGFGYDPVFIPEGELGTFAELPDETKNRLSHRARALAEIRPILDNLVR